MRHNVTDNKQMWNSVLQDKNIATVYSVTLRVMTPNLHGCVRLLSLLLHVIVLQDGQNAVGNLA